MGTGAPRRASIFDFVGIQDLRSWDAGLTTLVKTYPIVPIRTERTRAASRVEWMGETKLRLRSSLFLAAIVSLASAAAVTRAQSDYPNRVIKIVVAVPAGGAADTLARIVADRLTAKWDKPVIVVNHPGATGNIAAETVWKAQPDGYTLLLAPPPPLVINQSLSAKLPFAPATFKPVTVIAAIPNVLVARRNFAASNVGENDRAGKGEAGQAQLRIH
jgi:hypothetical protein